MKSIPGQRTMFVKDLRGGQDLKSNHNALKWLFAFNSNFVRVNQAHRSAGKILQGFDHP
jgi:hypothetical protein